MSDWRDDHDHDPLEFEEEEPPPATSAPGEGVRILGPEGPGDTETEHGGDSADDADDVWGERAIDFDLPGEDDATWSASSEEPTDRASRRRRRGRGRRGDRGADAADVTDAPTRDPLPDASGPVRLPHWTEPPTGEVPQVISGEHPQTSVGDDLDTWATNSGQTPRYRTESSDWAESDFSNPDVLRDDTAALGALSEDDDVLDDDAEFEEQVAARRRGGRRRPPPPPRGTLEEEEPAAEEPAHAPPDLITRVLTAVAIAVVALIVLRLGRVPTTVMVAVIIGAAAFELYEAFRRAGYHPATVLGLLGCLSIVPIAYANGVEAFPLVIFLVVAFTMLWYMAEVVKARPIINIAITLFTFVYIGVFGAFAGLLLSAPDGTGFILGVAICAIGYDVAGYFIGSQFGRSRMSPRLSPNKTWEGLLGGMVASVVLGVILGRVLTPWNGKISHGLALGLVVAILAPVGDLCESMIKRDLGIKDLGSILPGHGGVLDRFDAMLFCLPAVYYLAVQLDIG